MHVTLLTALTLTFAYPPEYFEYDMCKDDCKRRNVSCMIEEHELSVFSNYCVESVSVCEIDVSPTAVCLSPGLAPRGGQESWPRYRAKYFPPTTTTPRPRPDNGDNCLTWKIASSIQISLDIIFALCYIGIRIYRRHATIPYENVPEESDEQSNGNERSNVGISHVCNEDVLIDCEACPVRPSQVYQETTINLIG